jgi:hypothetical protein
MASSSADSERDRREAALSSALRALAEDDAHASGASAAVEARLLAEVRAIANANGDVNDHANVRVAARTPRWYRAVFAATALLVAAGLLFIVMPMPPDWRWHAPPHSRGTATAATQRTATELAAAATASRASARWSAEAATAFLPLVYSNVPFTNAQLVRMQVSRKALASFGLTTIDTRVDETSATVLADVLIGEDGLARAVRFVRPAAARRE